MARGRSGRVVEIKGTLTERLQTGTGYRPGERFLSARELSAEFGISYQTAHRLLAELETEGLLERRAASGTYVPGAAPVADSVASPCYSEARLVFSRRAARAQSFGARLLAELAGLFRREGIHWQVQWESSPEEIGAPLPPDAFPVLWEAPGGLERCMRERRPALLLNARPAPGLATAGLDSVSVDDHFGGACAADLLLEAAEDTPAPQFAVVTGPEGDTRSDARRDGFLSRSPQATIIIAGGWYREHGLDIAEAAICSGPDGIFCANDRLAEAILLYARRHHLPRPRVVGFDDAPVAATEELTTIAIPWEELASDAVGIVRRRLAGDRSTSRRLLVTPRPILRCL